MIDLIQAATLTNNSQLQKTAQAAILKQRIERPDQFFIQTATILQSADISINIRHAAGTLLTVSLKFKNGEQFLWDQVSPSMKATFKDMVLGTMIDKEKNIRRAAANIVAAICCIQIPRGEWPGIADKITANMNNEDLIVKEVSILTIGFICEQLREFNFQFDDQLQQTILTGILLGAKDSHKQISETAFKALRDGIPAVASIMKNDQYRTYLINQIAEALKSKHLIELALQCLVEFIKTNFVFMSQQYFVGFASIIDPILKNAQEESVCIVAMDFWSTFAKEERSIQSNPNEIRYLQGPLAQRIVQDLLQNLCYVQEGDQEDNGISDSASSALQAIFEGGSSQFQKKVLDFTDQKIKHQNWRFRQASIRAFASLLIGLPQHRSQQLVNISLIPMVALLQDPKQYVQYSAIRALCLIAEQTGSVILNHQNFLQILELIVKKLSVNQNFMRFVCRIIDNLCTSAQQDGNKILCGIADQMIKLFLDSCLQPSRSVSSINCIFSTILNLLAISQNNVVANKYIDYVLANFSQIQNADKQRRDIYYSGFFTIIQVSLITIRKASGSITMDILSNVYNLVVQYYTKIGDVQTDGFYVVSALAYFIPNDLRLVEDFWKYIEHGLKKTNQDNIFKSTISCICDFASIYKGLINQKIDNIFNQLISIFETNLITRELKLDVLMCFGQLFLQCGQASLKHLRRVSDILLISCQGVVNINDVNYAEVLQQTVIQTFMCLFHGLNNENKCFELAEYIKYVFQFVSITTDKARHPKLDYVKESMVLLGDIVSLYQTETIPFVNSPFITDRTSILIKYNKNGNLTNSINYIRQQFKLAVK